MSANKQTQNRVLNGRKPEAEKAALITQIPEFDKATRKLVKVPKEAIEAAERDEARKGKRAR